MKTAPRSDRDARRLAQSEFDRPVAVEAGAGTGKTTVLVARSLAWCLGRGWIEAQHYLTDEGSTDPSQDRIAARVLDGLVAITFTEAAAAQMASRVARGLSALAVGRREGVIGFFPELLEPHTDRDALPGRARALIGALDHLAVRTIHSHCWNLLATYAMETGLSPDLRVDADGRHLEEVVREVVEAAIKEAYAGPGDHPLRRLARRLIDPRDVAEAIHEWVSLGVGSEALRPDPLSAKRRRDLCLRLAESTSAVHSLAAPLARQSRAKKARQVAEGLDRTLVALAASSSEPDKPRFARLLDELREIWVDDLVDRLGKWAVGEFTKTALRVVGDDITELTRAAGRLAKVLRLCLRIDVEVLDAGRRALEPLIARVEEGLRSRGVATYASLMSEAWRLLAEQPRVRRREQRRIRQLLVDEFQDTDRLQCELVRLLALTGDTAERPGLFVVGDPKQSIYGWRDADLEAYETFLQDLQGQGGVAVRLHRNFRSVPAVLEEVDRVMQTAMIAEAGVQPTFEGLEAREDLLSDPGFCRGDRRAVEYWVSWRARADAAESPLAATSADEAARLEAAAVASDIRELHDRQATAWSEFGLLLRSTSRLESFLEAFRKADVPFVVTSDKHYFRRREVIEAAALIRTVINPVDHVALITVLRSAAVGVPDAALLPLWRRNLPELVTQLDSPAGEVPERLRAVIRQVAAELPDGVPGLDEVQGWEVSATAALDNLALLRRSFRTDSADRFLEHLRHRFLIDVTESARYLGRYRLANLDSLFRRLERAFAEQGGDTQAVLRALRRSVAEAEEAEEALPEGAAEDAVRVMTIHRAKGLEFGHVYLAQLHSRGRKNDLPAIRADRRWIPGQQADYVLFGSPTPGFDRVEEREARVELAEQVRTLYVAMTRAQKRLVLVGRWPEIPSPVPQAKRDTYLALLRSRAELPESIAELLERCQRAEGSFVDAAGVRWRFPDLEPRIPRRSDAERHETTLPSTADIRHESLHLEREREIAGQRMERAMSGTASAEAADRLERLLEVQAGGDGDSPGRLVARRVGEAFHRMLETWDLDAEPEAELEIQRRRQHLWLTASLPGDRARSAQESLGALLERFHGGRLWRRFLSVAPYVVARELPVLLPPGDGEDAPLSFVSGSVDLLYRDPDSQELIVVDFKTDRVEEANEIAERVAVYSPQEAVYARALQESLALQRLPSCQLWFIWADRTWENSRSRP